MDIPDIRIKQQADSITLPPSENQQRISQWLDSAMFQPNTRKVYRRALHQFDAWLDGDSLLWVPATVAAQYRRHLESLMKEDQLKVSTINTAMVAVKSFYTWFNKNYPEQLSVNPFKGISLFRAEPLQAQNIAPELVSRLFELAEGNSRDLLIFHLLFHGLRSGEVAALNMGAICAGVLFIAHSKNGESRQVPLSKDAQAVLDKYLSELQYQGVQWDEQTPLIIRSTSKGVSRLSYAAIYKRVRKIGKAAGLENMHPHLGRHTYCSNLILAGMSPVHASTLSGHRSSKSFDRYITGAKQQAAIDEYRRIFDD